MPKKRILIIEDRSDDAHLLSRLLESRELDTSCVGTLAEGLECLRVQRGPNQFHLVLCDVNLPDSNGIETIAATPKFGDMPIIMVTGSEDRDIIRACAQAGLGLEFKPIDVPSLMGKIWLRLNRNDPSLELSNRVVEEHHRAQEATPIKETTLVELSLSRVMAIAVTLVTCTAGITYAVLNKMTTMDANVSRIGATLTEMVKAQNEDRAAALERQRHLDKWRGNVSRDIRELGVKTGTRVETTE